ncbi:MAG: NTP transferase domain-containing protein, partial [Methanoregula sp.]|nr:NTP transferase domain-containing protein [Methanoregula sp.]
MYALIMAGGSASRLGAGEKALTRIRDHPLISYTLDAVTRAGLVPIVIVSPKTPYTTNYCRIHGVDWICTSGSGYVEDIHEAVKILEINDAVLTVCADLPGISPDHITEIV